jgi:hypothetical protein
MFESKLQLDYTYLREQIRDPELFHVESIPTALTDLELAHGESKPTARDLELAHVVIYIYIYIYPTVN